jgi:hypothetical protein
MYHHSSCANYIVEWEGGLMEMYIDKEKQRVTNETYYLLEWGAQGDRQARGWVRKREERVVVNW